MKLFLYYASHSIFNQIKKLLRTWVAVFILVCVLLGGLIGIGAGFLIESLPEGETPPADEEVLPEEEEEMPTAEEIHVIADLVTTAVLLVALTLGILRADKSGSQIFQGGDVALLFPSPMKPQSVLLFRLSCGLGSILIVGLYLLFQIPNMIELGAVFIVSLFLALGLTVVLSQFVSVLFYLLSTAHPRMKKYLRGGLYAFLALLLLGVFAVYETTGVSPIEAAALFFASPYTRLFPLFGWLKGGFMYAMEGDLLFAAIGFLMAAAGGAGLLALCYRIKADYYEEAVAATEEKAAALLAASEGRAAARKKERADGVRRDGLRHGNGASVFFFKAVYNRFRFAYFRVFTKTSVLYLFAAACVAAVYLLTTKGKGDGLTYLFVTGLILGGLSFFRALGSPLNTDLSQSVFFMSPDSHRSKLFYSLLGGSACLALDLIPALLVSTLVFWVNPLYTLLLLLFIASVDLYSAGVGVFLELILPTSLDKNVRAVFLVMFVYFGLLPVAAALILGWLLVNAILGFLLGTATCLAVGGVLLLFAPAILSSGRR